MTRRLDEVLANAGVGSRREIKALISVGRVCVDGQTVKRSDMRVEESSCICVDGKEIDKSRYVYLLMNKPCGYVSSTEDKDSLLKLIPAKYMRKDLFPVGRLDKDTSGLIFVTNDGNFSHAVTSPSKHTKKTYEAVLENDALPSYAEMFSAGMTLRDGTVTMPAEFCMTDDPKIVRVTLCEGKYHEVRRMFACLGNMVVALKRISIENIFADIPEGEVRPLTNSEIFFFIKTEDTKNEK